MKEQWQLLNYGLRLTDRELPFVRLLKERQFMLDTLPKSREAGWRDNHCVFVLSTGRAGTMQLSGLLKLSRNILALHEPTPVLLQQGRDAYAEPDAEVWVPLLHAARDELIAFANQIGKVYVETNNRMTFLATALAKAYPSSKFIHLHRHPHQVIRSGLARNWYGGSGLDYARVTPLDGDPMAECWSRLEGAEKIAWFWTRVNEASMDLISGLDASRGLTLPADELFAGAPETLSRLFAFVGGSPPPSKAASRILRQRLNANRKASPTEVRWQTSDLGRRINSIVGPVANALGYDLEM